MTAGRWRLRLPELLLLAGGATLTVLVTIVSRHVGSKLGLEALAGVFVYVVAVIAFIRAPHIAVAATIALFEVLPTLKVFTSPSIGGIKDLIGFAAITAAAILIVFSGRRIDRRIAVLTALFMVLYIVNPGHAHNVAWAQGVRLIGEPTLLLIAGLTLPNPRRTARWALGALVGVGTAIAVYGLFQQYLGPDRLVALGYSYNLQVRTIGSFFRSFGTLDDPFTYAAVLYLALGVAFFWLRRGPIMYLATLVLLLGLAASLVRTALAILVAFGALELIRRHRLMPAVAAGAAALVLGGVAIAGSGASRKEPFTVYFANGGTIEVQSPVSTHAGGFALNGRVSAWQAAVGSNPVNWVFGRGVGTVGTAAVRASESLIPGGSSSSSSSKTLTAVDSGYVATIADVGLIGLIIQLALFWRIGAIAALGARAGFRSGWAALALLVSLLIDATTRGSFDGFPSAFVGMLVIGIALAAVLEQLSERPTPSGALLGGRMPPLTDPGL